AKFRHVVNDDQSTIHFPSPMVVHTIRVNVIFYTINFSGTKRTVISSIPTTPFVLNNRQNIRALRSKVGIQLHPDTLSSRAFFGSDKNDTVSTSGSIQSRCTGPLQYCNGFHIIGVYIADTIAEVPSIRKVGGIQCAVVYRHAVQYVQRLIAAGKRTCAPDDHTTGSTGTA